MVIKKTPGKRRSQNFQYNGTGHRDEPPQADRRKGEKKSQS
jgi:hypothetical protein